MRVAIIDLGTNTFNLFIADLHNGGKPEAVYKNRFPVRLGDRIVDGIISPEAYDRGISAIRECNSVIKKFNPDKAMAFGTSAIRSAVNGKEFCQDVFEISGLDVTVINGNQEADYIYNGVREAVELGKEPVLILDIGGGSNELIIANNEKIFWKHSFNLGIARLLQIFNPTDPLPVSDEEKIKAYLNKELEPLFEIVKHYPVTELIGASGSFETFAELSARKKNKAFEWNGTTEYVFNDGEYEEVFLDLRHSSREERVEMEGMMTIRADMIVLAGVFINVVKEGCAIRKIRVSDYALKEGAMFGILKS